MADAATIRVPITKGGKGAYLEVNLQDPSQGGDLPAEVLKEVYLQGLKVLLSRGAADFLIVKHVLASLGVMGIALHPGRRAAVAALFVLLPLYSLLAVYQIALFYIM